MPTEIDELADLIADARRMPPAMLPRPRRPRAARTIDLTAPEVQIPATTLSLVAEYDDYGS